MLYVHMVGNDVWYCKTGYGLPLDPSVKDDQGPWIYMGAHDEAEVLPVVLNRESCAIKIYDCQEEDFIDLDEFTGKCIYDNHHRVAFVSVYAETRHYGGPEEGGWWYNVMEHITWLPMINPGNRKEVERLTDILRPRFISIGDINSVNGGVRYHVIAESKKGGSENTRRPHYE